MECEDGCCRARRYRHPPLTSVYFGNKEDKDKSAAVIRPMFQVTNGHHEFTKLDLGGAPGLAPPTSVSSVGAAASPSLVGE